MAEHPRRRPDRGRRPGRGVGLVAGLTALAAGGVAAGFGLERRLVGSRLRPALTAAPTADEGFFGLRGRPGGVTADDGVWLYTEVDEADAGAGPGEPTVVLVHGYGLSMDCFHFQRRHLRGRYRLVLYDQRSHGRSGRSEPDHCRIPQLGRDLQRVLAELVPTGPVVLIGHSMGGMSIMELARTRPELFGEQVVGVGLLSTSSGKMAEYSPVRIIPARHFGRVAETLMAGLNRLPKLVDAGRRAGTDIGLVVTRQYAFGSDVPVDYVRFVAEMLGETSLQVVADFYPAFAELDEIDAFDVLQRVETAVIGGADDLITPPAHTQAIIDLLPGADALIMAECGHMGLIEHHDRFDEILDRLLARVERNLTAGGERRPGAA